MICVVIPADTQTPVIKDLDEPLYKTAGKEVGGYTEVVHPRRLESPFCLLVNEEGLIMNLPTNQIGSYWYGTDVHGYPIVGDIIVMKDGYTNGEPDIVGLSEEQAAFIVNKINKLLED